MKRLALIGSKGMLAGMVSREAPPECETVGLDLPELDITDAQAVARVLAEIKPSVIVNCAALTDVDGCETKEDLATSVNGEAPGYLAEEALELGATLVHISTDYVFDGTKRAPYVEEDPPNPLSAYGRSKLLGERRIQQSGLEEYYIIRTSWLYGPGGKNFVETIARLAGERDELRVVADQYGTPTYTVDLARAIFALLGSALVTHCPSPATAPYGVYHFSGEGTCTWHGFAEEIVRRLRERGPVRANAVRRIRTDEYPLPAPRPAYSVFSKEKYKRATGASIPHWRESLARYLEERA